MSVMQSSQFIFLDVEILLFRYKVCIILTEKQVYVTYCFISLLVSYQQLIIHLIVFAGKVNNITIDKCTKTGVLFKVSMNILRALFAENVLIL